MEELRVRLAEQMESMMAARASPVSAIKEEEADGEEEEGDAGQTDGDDGGGAMAKVRGRC